jgi:hypothetical protein
MRKAYTNRKLETQQCTHCPDTEYISMNRPQQKMNGRHQLGFDCEQTMTTFLFFFMEMDLLAS